ncbi:MAG: gliding motility protein GldB [Tannerellaceae bacterium]|jgi:hypothetical protein|nr:gliding motility protein GldB [Tannerellaceae bacterium]
MRTKIVFMVALLISCAGCKGQDEAEAVRIYRFDKALFRLLEAGNDVGIQGELLCDYPEMMEVLGKGVLNMQSPEAPGFFDRLTTYYSEPTLKGLYRDAIAAYDSIADLERQLGQAFAYLEGCFPAMSIPRMYMHVSGLSQNVLTADNLLSISIDKYMGRDYPLYRNFFYDYQREKMQRSRIVPDYLTGWLLSEYPFAGKEDVLLERMVYEGKIKYLVSRALPEVSARELMAYTETDYAWCRKHEPEVWKTIVERKQLYTPDLISTDKYIGDAPASFLSGEAPGSLGVWIGWQIVRLYMEETGATPDMLMRNVDAQDVLTKSKYKPF